MPGAAERALIVFARAPAPGRVKTRLAPLLGARGATRLHARLVERTLETAVAAGFTDIELCCAPDTGGRFFARMRARFKLRLRRQGPGNLGERMYRALRRRPGAVLIGSDCPALRPADLRAAARALETGADAVLAPAEDGGYALIGLRRAERRVFDGIGWGGAEVLARTRARLRSLGWRWRELRTVWDVDRPQDVARLARSKRFAPLVARLAAARPRPTFSAARRRARPSAGSRRRSGAPGRT
ncbi:MAG TPA: TIGR04282 family arsenosugar biosynthesis glycosyltransferase [Burkholderiales bacterium]|nr:TIGR04282 family arsenosugar biosynthesis glycosyltransferase [Burkholderiales bacterium]